ncbi:hypothetical protein GCM10010965_22630 [Caldalkalibacillus thermarum]|nr:hypothetical protein GCM10010965_22630 [Caldalkalibacillus thermarum]
MDNNGLTYDLRHFEFVRKETHFRIPVIEKQYGKVTGMITMRISGWIPVFTCILEWILRISDFTCSKFMDVESMGAIGSLTYP